MSFEFTEARRKRDWIISISLSLCLIVGGWIGSVSSSNFFVMHAIENASHCDTGSCGFTDASCASHCIFTYTDSAFDATLPSSVQFLVALVAFGALTFLFTSRDQWFSLRERYVHSNRECLLSIMKRE